MSRLSFFFLGCYLVLVGDSTSAAGTETPDQVLRCARDLIANFDLPLSGEEPATASDEVMYQWNAQAQKVVKFRINNGKSASSVGYDTRYKIEYWITLLAAAAWNSADETGRQPLRMALGERVKIEEPRNGLIDYTPEIQTLGKRFTKEYEDQLEALHQRLAEAHVYSVEDLAHSSWWGQRNSFLGFVNSLTGLELELPGQSEARHFESSAVNSWRRKEEGQRRLRTLILESIWFRNLVAANELWSTYWRDAISHPLLTNQSRTATPGEYEALVRILNLRIRLTIGKYFPSGNHPEFSPHPQIEEFCLLGLGPEHSTPPLEYRTERTLEEAIDRLRGWAGQPHKSQHAHQLAAATILAFIGTQALKSESPALQDLGLRLSIEKKRSAH